VYRLAYGAHYESGTGFSAAFWIVIAVPFLIVALATAGVVSDVFWGLAGLLGLLALTNLAYYVTGHGRGGWSQDSPSTPLGR
jgi:hypothetical protein